MPTFHQYLDSIKDAKQHQEIRIQLVRDIENLTARKLIIYAADFTKANRAPTGIDLTDKVGFSDLIEGIEGNPLDVFIHSPGGAAEATEGLVKLLRANFNNIRFIVPHTAMSAATMMCLSGNWILMDDRSSLGPIDPQIQIGGMWFPAQVIIDSFEKAQEAITKDPNALAVFLPWLTQFGPFVQVCRDAKDMAVALAKEWLITYMFTGTRNRRQRAERIVNYLINRGEHMSHSRQVSIDTAQAQRLNIIDMRSQPVLRKLVWQLYCCVELYFIRTPAFKLFENAHGVSWARNVQQLTVQLPLSSVPTPPPPTAQPE